MITHEAIERIAPLYRIEAQAKGRTVDGRLLYRQPCAVPLLNAIKAWLDILRAQVPGNSGTT